MTKVNHQRALVAGWFSFEEAAAGVGDMLAKDLVCEWLDLAGLDYDVALAPPFTGAVDYNSVDPANYSHVIFVCGPFYKSNLLKRFENCHRFGINLTMLESVDSWNPFDLLLERDSSARSSAIVRPDVTFLSRAPKVPVVGIIQGGVRENTTSLSARYDIANAAIQELARSREISAVAIDTRLDIGNQGGLRTPAEVESLIARMDVVLTTRLHGMVLALKNAVPALAIDAVNGGHKIRRQAEAIGWPAAFTVDDLDPRALSDAFDYCLTDAARAKAVECSRRAAVDAGESRRKFITAIRSSCATAEDWKDGRRRGGWLPGQPRQNNSVSASTLSWTRLRSWMKSALMKYRRRFRSESEIRMNP